MNIDLDLQTLIPMAIVGLAAGWIASKLVKNKDMGLLGMLIIGVLGAFLGNWLFKLVQISISGNVWVNNIIEATVGAVIVLWLYNILNDKKRKKS